MPRLLTRPAALAEGWSVADVDAHVRAGRWSTVRGAVYWTAPALPDLPAHRHALEVAAAVLSTSAPSVGSHASAAVVHGLPLLRPRTGPPVLTRLRVAGAPRDRHRRTAALVSTVLDRERVVVLGAPVTSLARTGVDLARVLPPLEAAVVLDAVLASVPREHLLACLEHMDRWPGSVAARRAVAFADGRVESPLESVGRLRFAELGLPAPELQVVVGGLEASARVDFLWREQRTVGEADGRLKYAGPADLWAEKQREDRLRDDGFEVFRFGWADALHRPEVLRERAERAFARARLRRHTA